MTLTHVKDISKWQGDADVTGHIRAGNKALIIRAYSGYREDARFDEYRREAHAAGVRVLGLYAYLESSGASVRAQAEAFCRAVGELQPGEFALLDLEEGPGRQDDEAREWLRVVDDRLGGRAWIYSGEAFAKAHGLVPLFRERHGIVAAYRDDPEPGIPHVMWQHTNGTRPRHVDPQLGKVDCSVFHGTIADLLELVTPTAAKPVDTPPTKPTKTSTTSKPKPPKPAPKPTAPVPQPREEIDMAAATFVKKKAFNTVWVTDLMQKRVVANPPELHELQGLVRTQGGDPAVHVLSDSTIDRIAGGAVPAKTGA